MRERVHYPFSPPTILELQNKNIYSHLNIFNYGKTSSNRPR